jgi:hypothetical protein
MTENTMTHHPATPTERQLDRIEGQLDHLHDMLHFIRRQNRAILLAVKDDTNPELAAALVELTAKNDEIEAAMKAATPPTA